MEKTAINILWDASPLWGHLVLNAVVQSGLSYRVISGKDCSENGINAQILIVPGGSGRSKAKILGEKGKLAIQKFVENGGIYLGLCGGAGLALNDDKGGLGLCPWGRNFYKDRTQHLISGHVVGKLIKDGRIPEKLWQTDAQLPVWWPGRFAEPHEPIQHNELQGEVKVLARYVDMGEDLYLSDLPLKKLPPSTLEDWYNLYGVNLRPNLLNNQPCIIGGDYGKGQYILSYSHLETPYSHDVNSILQQILKQYLTVPTEFGDLPNKNDEEYLEISGKSKKNNALNTIEFNVNWLMPENNADFKLIETLYYELNSVFSLAEDLHLLFPRNIWLYGWHSSIPGSQLNALRIALMRSLHLPSTEGRVNFLAHQGISFQKNMHIFVQGAKNWLLAKKLSLTLTDSEIISDKIIQEQKKELFGQNMLGGGLCGALIQELDRFLFLE